jgi:replicative DNA helicase
MQENIDNLAKYGQSFQTKIISALLSDKKFIDVVYDIIDPNYFENESNKWIVKKVIEYYTEFKSYPPLDYFKVETSKISDDIIKTSIIDQLRHAKSLVGNVDTDYIQKEFIAFCKNQHLKSAILKAVDLLKLGKYDAIKDLVDSAMKVGDQTDLGTNYKDDFEERYEEINRNTVGTPWAVINDLMDGGLGPGELGVIVGGPGAGKTWLLSIIGAFAVKAGLKVLHYSHELSELYVTRRYDTIMSGIPTTDLAERKMEVKSIVKGLKGELQVKYFPPKISVNKFHSHIEKMSANGFKPDLVIIDYADLLRSSTKSDSKYDDQGEVYIDLRVMASELEVPIWTASQVNREGSNSEIIEGDKIADSFAKMMNADFAMSWSRRSKDKLNNTARCHIMKNRFGPDGMTFPSKMDTFTGFVDVFEGNSAEGMMATKDSANGQNHAKEMLHKKYVEQFG